MSVENIGPCECCGSTTTGEAECVFCNDEHIIEINSECLGFTDHVPGHSCVSNEAGDRWLVIAPDDCPTGGTFTLTFTIRCEAGQFFLAWEIADAGPCDSGEVEGTINSLSPLDVDFSFTPNGSCCPCGASAVDVSLTE